MSNYTTSAMHIATATDVDVTTSNDAAAAKQIHASTQPSSSFAGHVETAAGVSSQREPDTRVNNMNNNSMNNNVSSNSYSNSRLYETNTHADSESSGTADTDGADDTASVHHEGTVAASELKSLMCIIFV